MRYLQDEFIRYPRRGSRTLYDPWDPLSGEAAFEVEPEVASRPIPGRFYAIQFGQGGLLKTAERAYQTTSNAERLQRAREINSHPLNRRFWRPPGNDFEGRYFPEGIISFNKVFTCGPDQGLARGNERRCYATIWIPPEAAIAHRSLGRGASLPATDLSLMATSDDWCSDQLRDRCGIFGEDTRAQVPDTTQAPYRWICHLSSVFEDEMSPGFVIFRPATGLLISDWHVVTAAHVLYDHIEYKYMEEGQTRMRVYEQQAIAVIITPGRQGTPGEVSEPLDGSAFPFATFIPDDTDSDDSSGTPAIFKVPTEWIKSIGRADRSRYDYGLIKISKADRFSTDPALPRPKGFWGASHPGGALQSVIPARLGKRINFSSYENKAIHVAGYPEDRSCTQWEAEGRALEVLYPGRERHNVLTHDMDIVGGMSGSPVWHRRELIDRRGVPVTRLELLGLVSHCVEEETGDGVKIVNEATLITPGVWKRLSDWMAQMK
ncbi:MAG TPA: hypothetical protein VGG03_09035 [Thermoanaerobaculia bacterium]|jgi:V8-like Glu-specific endopeptidase